MYNQTTTGRAAGAPVAADTEGRSAPAGAALRSSAQLCAASAALRSLRSSAQPPQLCAARLVRRSVLKKVGGYWPVVKSETVGESEK